jgi:hypothetical protein
MFYEQMGRAHAASLALCRRIGGERGQGTVEYVGLVLLIGILLAGVVTASKSFNDKNSIAGAVMNKLKDAISTVGGSSAATPQN